MGTTEGNTFPHISARFFRMCWRKAIIWVIISVSIFKKQHREHIFGNAGAAPIHTQPQLGLLPC